MFQVNGLYGHIQRNTLKSVLLLLGFVGLLSVFWGAWCVIYSALFWKPVGLAKTATVWPRVQAYLHHGYDIAMWRWWVPVLASICWFAIAFVFQANLIRLATGARGLQRREAPKLYNTVENLAITAGLPVPTIEIMETSALNAYAAGLGPNEATIAVTRGLIETLDHDELEAVIAHEMTHIKNRDVRLMTVAGVFAGGLTLVGDLARRGFRARSDAYDLVSPGTAFDLFRIFYFLKPSTDDLTDDDAPIAAGGKLVGFVAVVVTIIAAVFALFLVHLFAILSQLAISRSREFMADAGAVELTKNPDALISALEKIAGNDAIPGLSDNVAAMMISSSIEGLFSTHPATNDRVKALEDHAGGKRTVRAPRSRPARLASPAIGMATASGFAGGGAVGFGRRSRRPAMLAKA